MSAETGEVIGCYFQILGRNAAKKVGPWYEISKDVSILKCEPRKSITQSSVTWCVSHFSRMELLKTITKSDTYVKMET